MQKGSASRRPFSFESLGVREGTTSEGVTAMRNDQAELVERLVRDHEALEDRMEAEARATAQGIIQSYIGPDHKVIKMQDFYGALVFALKSARERGQADNADGHVLTLT